MIVALFDTLSDSTQCVPKNYSIKKLIQHCLPNIQFKLNSGDSIQMIIPFKIEYGDSIQKIIPFKIKYGDSIQQTFQFNREGIIDTDQIRKMP